MKLLKSLMGVAVPARNSTNRPPPESIVADDTSVEEIASVATASVVSDINRLIIDGVFRVDNTQQPQRIDTEYIHVSAMKDLCPRKYALVASSGDVVYDKVRSADRIIWAIGRAVENHIRKSYIESTDYSGVIGKWACRCGKSEIEGIHDRNLECTVCGTGLDHYRELPLFDHENRIVGNPDMLVEVDGLVYVVEIKSIKGGAGTASYKGFDELDGPMGDHVFQAQMYRYLLAVNGYSPANEVIIVYGSKDYTMRKEPLKEFHVDVSTPEYESIVASSVEAARSIFGNLAGGALPPRILCDSINCSRAKQCQVSGRCFNAD